MIFTKYLEHSLSLIPVNLKGKNPTISGWEEFCTRLPTEAEASAWDRLFQNGMVNVGLCLGPVSDLVALDIDTDDPEFIAKFPKSPIVKRGAKGETRFFRGGKKIESRSYPCLDILSANRQTIIPPSIHMKTGKPYTWMIGNILNFDELPELDLSFLHDLNFENYKIKTTEGRNNKLVDIISAMRGRGESESNIIKEVYEWDLKHHSPRLFTDSSEQFCAKTEDEARKAAWTMVLNVTKSLVSKGIVEVTDDRQVVDIDPSQIKETITPYPETNGLLGLLQEYAKVTSIRQNPAISLGGAIAVMSYLCSNRFRFGNIWPNLYILNVARTGHGKSFPEAMAEKFLCQKFKQPGVHSGAFHSVAALTKNLVSERERLWIIDEVSSLFRRIKEGGNYQADISEALCKLWSKSNGYFGGDLYAQRDDTSSCNNPCVNILGSTTPELLKETINLEMVKCGLLPRFLVFHDSGHYEASIPGSIPEGLEEAIIENIKLILRQKKLENKESTSVLEKVFSPIDLAPSKLVHEKFCVPIFKKYNSLLSESIGGDITADLYSRAYEQICRLATIHAVSRCNLKQIDETDVLWAESVYEACISNSIRILESGALEGGSDERDINKVKEILFEKKVIKHSELLKKSKMTSKRFGQIIETLGDSGFLGTSDLNVRGKKVLSYKYLG